EQFALRSADGFAAALPHLRLLPGRAAALFGPSGSGKSSLLLALFGLGRGGGPRASGRVQLFGRGTSDWAADRPPARRQPLRQRVAWVMQDAAAALDPLLPVGQQIERAAGCTEAAGIAALAALTVADAAAVWRRLPHQISGGQAQRVLLAVALLRRPELLV